MFFYHFGALYETAKLKTCQSVKFDLLFHIVCRKFGSEEWRFLIFGHHKLTINNFIKIFYSARAKISFCIFFLRASLLQKIWVVWLPTSSSPFKISQCWWSSLRGVKRFLTLRRPTCPKLVWSFRFSAQHCHNYLCKILFCCVSNSPFYLTLTLI